MNTTAWHLALAAAVVVTAVGCGRKPDVSASTSATANPGTKSNLTPKNKTPEVEKPIPVGLLRNDPGAFQGYTLLAAMNSTRTYLIDMEGKIVRRWKSEFPPGLVAYLLPNGHLLRTAYDGKWFIEKSPGTGGRIQEFDWDGELKWDFALRSLDRKGHGGLQGHHDVAPLPNGNILFLTWEGNKLEKDLLAVGANFRLQQCLIPDCIIEIKPTGLTTGVAVWEWHAWDHLVQDHDKSKPNYDRVSSHPELIDVNCQLGFLVNAYADLSNGPKIPDGYFDPKGTQGKTGDDASYWTHFNSIDYNADLDQIMVSTPTFSEVWIIDHSTTTGEAKGHKGGKSGKGGDLLYRWGNPMAYKAGTVKDRHLFGLHHGHWIPKNLPGAGHVLVFNNGSNRTGKLFYSSVDEFELPPVDARGLYARLPDNTYGPEKLTWTYEAPNKMDLHSAILSGVQRLPNGNTLICSGKGGELIEVTEQKEIVWQFNNPVKQIDGEYPPDEREDNRYVTKPPNTPLVFRAYRYGPEYPAFEGKTLSPGQTIEEEQAAAKKKK